jgi:hypothetical protein
MVARGAGADEPVGSGTAGSAHPATRVPWWRRAWLGRQEGVEGSRFLAKWGVLAVLIGVVAGVGALGFYLAIRVGGAWTLGAVAGARLPEPAGEGATLARAIAHPWLVPVVTTLGGLVSGLIVFTLAPEAEGHGTDSAIGAFHYQAGQMRAHPADQTARLGNHDWHGRQRGPRGTLGPDLSRLRLRARARPPAQRQRPAHLRGGRHGRGHGRDLPRPTRRGAAGRRDPLWA